jgi:CheY-like chemotaxis protein
MQILVADNNKTITKIIKMALEEEGYSAQVAHSPDEVLDIISKSQFDIFILDTKFIKENDGYELVQKIKERGVDGKFILLISALEKPDNELAKKLGIYSFLTKPVDSRKLFQIISEIEEELKSEGKLKRKKQKIVHDEEILEVLPQAEIKRDSEKKNEYDYKEDYYTEDYSDMIREHQTKNLEKERKHQKAEYEGVPEYKSSTDNLDKDILDEKKDISFSWMEETAISMKDELLLLLNAVREIFSDIKKVKDEAENYIVEIRSSVGALKKKVEDIPEIDKIINKLLSDTLSYIEPKLGEKINIALEKKLPALISKSIETDLLNSIKTDLFNSIKKEVIEEAKEYIKNYQESITREISQNIQLFSQSVRNEYLNEIKKFEERIQSQIAEMISEKLKEFRQYSHQAESSKETLDLQEIDMIEDLTYETEDKSTEIREEEEKYGEIFQLSEEDIQFLEVEQISKTQERIFTDEREKIEEENTSVKGADDEEEKREQLKEDFLSVDEI